MSDGDRHTTGMSTRRSVVCVRAIDAYLERERRVVRLAVHKGLHLCAPILVVEVTARGGTGRTRQIELLDSFQEEEAFNEDAETISCT